MYFVNRLRTFTGPAALELNFVTIYGINRSNETWMKDTPIHQSMNLDLEIGPIKPLRTAKGAAQGNHCYDNC